MSIEGELKAFERRALQKWLPYAKAWGYRTALNGAVDPMHSRFELELHGDDFMPYGDLTCISDNVFRSIIQFNRNDGIFRDVYQKARMCSGTDVEQLRDFDGPVFDLLNRFFEGPVEEFAHDLENFNLNREMSLPFEIIINSALVLYSIVYGTLKDSKKYMKKITDCGTEEQQEQSDSDSE